MHDLECESLIKKFGSHVAVNDVSFEVPRGSFFSILGPSGCGKTTLMRMIAGFETPSSGDIRIKGKSVLASPPNKRSVKMVFQHLALFPMMNVGENIAYGLRCRGESRADIERKVAGVLERIGLPGVAQKQVSQLSGGQKQRIAIARCMVLEPDVLLLDEPLGALDLKLREALQFEIKRIQRSTGSTVVYVTHDQSEAMSMSDEIIILRDGKLVQRGSPKDVYDQPVNAFVATFVGQSNTASAQKGASALSVPDWQLEIASEHLRGVNGAAAPMVALRPEKLRLSAPEQPLAPGEASTAVTIENVQMFGNNLMVHLRLPNGKLLLAQQFRTGASERDSLFVIGATVHARFDAGDLLVLSA